MLIDGVFGVWFFRELSSATSRSSMLGMCRSVARTMAIRRVAAGDRSATNSPPSLPKPFCGEKK